MQILSRIPIRFRLNGKEVSLKVSARETALEMLRERLGLKGAKEGCGMGECGACTIVVDGKAVNACLMLAAQLDGRGVLTVEGLAQEGSLHPLQGAFIQVHAVQCGFCTPGLLMSAHALLLGNPRPDAGAMEEAFSGNLCRCTGYSQVASAVALAAELLSQEEKP